MHTLPCELGGKSIKIKEIIPYMGGRIMMIEDWFDRCFGSSWRMAGNSCVPAKEYGERIAKLYPNDVQLALSDDVVFGYIEGYHAAVHVTELDLPESKIETIYVKRNIAY